MVGMSMAAWNKTFVANLHAAMKFVAGSLVPYIDLVRFSRRTWLDAHGPDLLRVCFCFLFMSYYFVLHISKPTFIHYFWVSVNVKLFLVTMLY